VAAWQRIYAGGIAALALLALPAAGQEGPVLSTPLVFDLDGDGIEFLGPDDSGVYFDMDSDGFAELTGWIAADDGFLVLDRNGNGAVDDIGELLGWGEPLSLLRFYGEQQKGRLGTGFGLLRKWDRNGDGAVDAADPMFGQLAVWRDLDRDGVSRPGELQGLPQAGIAALATESNQGMLSFGRNTVCDSGFFSGADGRRFSLVGVRLDYNAQFTRFIGASVEDPRTAALPVLAGTGDAQGLSAAMSEDPELLRMVAEFAKLGVGDAQHLEVYLEEILHRWYRADGINSSGRGRHMDARRLAALERMQGTPWRSETGSDRPTAAQAAELTAAWSDGVALRMAQLLAQVPLGETLIPGVTYRAPAGLALPAGATLDGMLANMRRQAPGAPKAKVRYWRVMAQLLFALRPEFQSAMPADRRSAFESEFTREIDAVLVGEGVPYGYAQLRAATLNGSGALMIQ
jgi:hypothetical protein